MTYFEVIKQFIYSFFPSGSLLPAVSDLLVALLAIGGVMLLLMFVLTLLGVRSRSVTTVFLVVVVTVCVIYFWNVTPWYTVS